MDNLKKYHNIEKDITLQSKVENDHLFVFYKDQWIQLSYKKNPDSFYSNRTLRNQYDANLCIELGMINPNKYTKRVLKNTTTKRKQRNLHAKCISTRIFFFFLI